MVSQKGGPTIGEISDIATKILSDVSHTNEITTLLDVLSDANSDVIRVAVVSALKNVFSHFLTKSWMCQEVAGTDEQLSQYYSWMRETYKESYSAIVSHIGSETPGLADLAFSTALSFVNAETLFVKLSQDRITELVGAVLLTKNSDLVMQIAGEVSDLDWKYATLRAIEKFSKKHASNKDTELAVFAHQLLCAVDVSECFSDEHRDKKMKTDASKTIFHIRKAYNSTWVQFLKMPKSRELYHTILTNLHESVIPFMQNPKLLIDFLVDSYDLGGTSALLALNSLFILITQYNLDYPQFYPKLYRMLKADLYHAPYVTRFISMLDLFLKSPLLPAYLVAAFAKRLVRQSLQAPPHVIVIVLRLITNLTKLHPSVKRLVHRGPDHPAVRTDPFLPEEDDPAKCAALESSLWELEILNEHYCPGISSVVKTLRKPTDEILVDLGLSKGYDSLFKEYLKMWKQDPPLEFVEPLTFTQSEFADVFTF